MQNLKEKSYCLSSYLSISSNVFRNFILEFCIRFDVDKPIGENREVCTNHPVGSCQDNCGYLLISLHGVSEVRWTEWVDVRDRVNTATTKEKLEFHGTVAKTDTTQEVFTGGWRPLYKIRFNSKQH